MLASVGLTSKGKERLEICSSLFLVFPLQDFTSMNSTKPIINSNWKLVSELKEFQTKEEEDEFEEDEVSFKFDKQQQK